MFVVPVGKGGVYVEVGMDTGVKDRSGEGGIDLWGWVDFGRQAPSFSTLFQSLLILVSSAIKETHDLKSNTSLLETA